MPSFSGSVSIRRHRPDWLEPRMSAHGTSWSLRACAAGAVAAMPELLSKVRNGKMRSVAVHVFSRVWNTSRVERASGSPLVLQVGSFLAGWMTTSSPARLAIPPVTAWRVSADVALQIERIRAPLRCPCFLEPRASFKKTRATYIACRQRQSPPGRSRGSRCAAASGGHRFANCRPRLLGTDWMLRSQRMPHAPVVCR